MFIHIFKCISALPKFSPPITVQISVWYAYSFLPLPLTNCHLYNYANNNPVVYTDPDGRDARYDEFLRLLQEETYNEIVTGTQISMLNYQGQALNFFDNVKAGNYAAKFSGSFTLGLTSGTFSWEPLAKDSCIKHSVSICDIDTLYNFIGNCTSLDATFFVGRKKVSCSIKVLSIAVENNGDDTASASISVGLPNKIKKLLENTGDASLSLSITASTQNGIHGTLSNGKSNELRRKAYEYTKTREKLQEDWQDLYFNDW